MCKYKRRRILTLLSVSPLFACVSHQAIHSVEEQPWQPYFVSIDRGAVLVNLKARRLIYWGPKNKNYREFPIGTPKGPEFERKGYTKVVRKKAGPDWRPTPAMLKRNPDLPHYVAPGPNNPLGKYALYLGWQYYALHGTNDPATIGRRTTSGCIRLFNGHIKWMYDNVEIGSKVLII